MLLSTIFCWFVNRFTGLLRKGWLNVHYVLESRRRDMEQSIRFGCKVVSKTIVYTAPPWTPLALNFDTWRLQSFAACRVKHVFCERCSVLMIFSQLPCSGYYCSRNAITQIFINSSVCNLVVTIKQLCLLNTEFSWHFGAVRIAKYITVNCIMFNSLDSCIRSIM